MATPPLDLTGVPREPGVYRFREATGRVLYIGRAVDLQRRVRSYWGANRGRPRMKRMVPKVAHVEVVTCASEHEAAWLERNLLEQSKPAWNRARGGLEVPVYLRLDPDEKAPSLTIVHDIAGGLQHFGPYLGGTRVRVAATALASLHPLAYSGERLTGAERSMAEARGVVPADRDSLVDALTGLLSRDPDAVQATRRLLESRRGDAAAALEFELAARFQEQLEAVDWLVSPQRVTSQDSQNFTAAGWADGILVEFSIKAGRVRTWKQTSASADDAARKLAATPPAWAPFSQRAAETAAQLQSLHLA